MTAEPHRLAERIRDEVPRLERTILRSQARWERALRSTEDADAFLDSAALKLHGFYSALERIWELVATQVDESLPVGDGWHIVLLRLMAASVEGARPAVISETTAAELDEMRRFRHVVRNVYSDTLDRDRMRRVFGSIPQLWPRLKSELLVFADFLEALDNSST